MNPIIKTENLVKRYGDLIALDHLNLEVYPGEIFGLLGPNGSGKTSAINTILSLLTYDKGSISLFGRPMQPDAYDIKRRIGLVIRFVNDILLSAPSIVLGLFVYTLVVAQMGGGFSAIAGALSLAFIVLPVIVRTTDEMLRLVPSQMREAALSLGVPQWKVIVQVLYRGAAPGIVTGIILALARISGETAPLLFTSFGNQYWSTDLTQPMASVPVVMNQFTASPYENWQSLAWAGALVLTFFVLVLSLIARAILSRNKSRHE